MKPGWHLYGERWIYWDKNKPNKSAKGRPSAIVLYAEGPCRFLQGFLRSGESAGYSPEQNFGLSLQTWADELSQELKNKGGELPEVVVRTDFGQLEEAIVNGEAVDNGFLSTSVGEEPPYPDRPVWYYIRGLETFCGAVIADVSKFDDEKEFLFDKDSRFVVEKSITEGNRRIYYLRYVGHAHRACYRSRVKFPAEDTCPFCGYPLNGEWTCPNCGAT